MPFILIITATRTADSQVKDTQRAAQPAQPFYCPNCNDNVVDNTAHSAVLIPKPAINSECEPAPSICNPHKPS